MGYVKLNRNIADSILFDDNELLCFYVKLLLRVRFSEGSGTIKRGELSTSINKLSAANGFSVQHTRTLLNKLREANLIKTRSSNFATVIRIVNFDCEDDFHEDFGDASTSDSTNESTSGLTNEQQTTNTPSLLLKERKNVRREEPRAHAKENFSISRDELVERFGEVNVLEYERRFHLWVQRQKAPVNVSCYDVIVRWMSDDGVVKPEAPNFDYDAIQRRIAASYLGG